MPGTIRSMHLEHVLRDVQTDRGNLLHGRLLRWQFDTVTLAPRCRRGASTSSPFLWPVRLPLTSSSRALAMMRPSLERSIAVLPTAILPPRQRDIDAVEVRHAQEHPTLLDRACGSQVVPRARPALANCIRTAGEYRGGHNWPRLV